MDYSLSRLSSRSQTVLTYPFDSIMFSGGLVAGTGVPMKVDTGLFNVQPTERDPTDSPRTEYKARCIMYRHQEKWNVRLCHTFPKNTGNIFWIKYAGTHILTQRQISVLNNINPHQSNLIHAWYVDKWIFGLLLFLYVWFVNHFQDYYI